MCVCVSVSCTYPGEDKENHAVRRRRGKSGLFGPCGHLYPVYRAGGTEILVQSSQSISLIIASLSKLNSIAQCGRN